MRGKYTILKKLAENSRTQVFLVEDNAVKKCWVMKVEKRKEAQKCGYSGRREMQILQRINHRGIALIIDYWEEEQCNCLVMEYVEGMTLGELIRRKGKIEEARALIWMAELADILYYLHHLEEPVYYLDMKPDNIMICPDGHVKLIDFGAAVCKGSRNETCKSVDKTVYRMGTYGYAAPEQYDRQSRKGPDERSDIYGLGMTLYAMTTGLNPAIPPYGMRPAKMWSYMVSDKVTELLLGCIREQPEQRYPSAAALLRRLEQLQTKQSRRKAKFFFQTIPKKTPVIQKKSCFYSDKKYAGLLTAGLLLAGIAFTSLTGKAAAHRERAEALLVILRNHTGEKVLLQDGAVFQLHGDLKIEIPREYLYAESTIIITVKEKEGSGWRERELWIHMPDAKDF